MSALTAGLGVALGLALFGQYIFGPYDDKIVPIFLTFCLECVAGIIGAIAGSTREIVSAQRRPPY